MIRTQQLVILVLLSQQASIHPAVPIDYVDQLSEPSDPITNYGGHEIWNPVSNQTGQLILCGRRRAHMDTQRAEWGGGVLTTSNHPSNTHPLLLPTTHTWGHLWSELV